MTHAYSAACARHQSAIAGVRAGNEGALNRRASAWGLATVLPGTAISLVVLGANLFGDGLRDLLYPYLRR